jgi:site-specific DNA-cytosine methylase
MPIRVLELFAGIGGLAHAWPDADIVQAIDIDTGAQRVYQSNFSHPYLCRELETIPAQALEAYRDALWWMSPPCTPFTTRGKQRDLDDPRCRALVHLAEVAALLQPPWIMLENVEGFRDSRARLWLMAQWSQVGYRVELRSLCPSQWGWPNRRPRVYLIAGRVGRDIDVTPVFRPVSLASMIDPSIRRETHGELWIDQETATRYAAAIHCVDVVDGVCDQQVTACFATSYGRSITRSGSYLRTSEGIRRFSAREVARLLGFSDLFQLPSEDPHWMPGLSKLERQQRVWRWLGNSLAIPVVRHLVPSCWA